MARLQRGPQDAQANRAHRRAPGPGARPAAPTRRRSGESGISEIRVTVQQRATAASAGVWAALSQSMIFGLSPVKITFSGCASGSRSLPPGPEGPAATPATRERRSSMTPCHGAHRRASPGRRSGRPATTRRSPVEARRLGRPGAPQCLGDVVEPRGPRPMALDHRGSRSVASSEACASAEGRLARDKWILPTRCAAVGPRSGIAACRRAGEARRGQDDSRCPIDPAQTGPTADCSMITCG